MNVCRQMETEEQRNFWSEVARSAREVEKWPAWLRGVREEDTAECSSQFNDAHMGNEYTMQTTGEE